MGSPIKVTGLNQEFFGPNQHGALRDAMASQSEIWFDYISALKDEELDSTFTYMDRYDKSQTRHRGHILDHVFNQFVKFFFCHVFVPFRHPAFRDELATSKSQHRICGLLWFPNSTVLRLAQRHTPSRANIGSVDDGRSRGS
jgi:hypothetical protein